MHVQASSETADGSLTSCDVRRPSKSVTKGNALANRVRPNQLWQLFGCELWRRRLLPHHLEGCVRDPPGGNADGGSGFGSGE